MLARFFIESHHPSPLPENITIYKSFLLGSLVSPENAQCPARGMQSEGRCSRVEQNTDFHILSLLSAPYLSLDLFCDFCAQIWNSHGSLSLESKPQISSGW